MVGSLAVDLSSVLGDVLVGDDAEVRVLDQHYVLVLLHDFVQDVPGSFISFDLARLFLGELGLEVAHRDDEQGTHDCEEDGHLPVDVKGGEHGEDDITDYLEAQE